MCGIIEDDEFSRFDVKLVKRQRDAGQVCIQTFCSKKSVDEYSACVLRNCRAYFWKGRKRSWNDVTQSCVLEACSGFTPRTIQHAYCSMMKCGK